VEIIPLAIDWTAWHDASPVAHTRPVVLFVGRVEGWKAPETLVRAMSLIRQAMPESEALFVGRIGQRDGMPYTEWLERTVGGTDGCRFLGPVPRNQIKAMLSMSRILALPSQFDAFGLVVLEAMSAGRPVVVSASAGSAEFVERAGGGVVVPPGDPAALAKGLLQFLRDPSYAAEVGERARAAVRRWLSPEKIAARREAMYEQAMRSFGRRRASPVDTTWLKGPVN
jgi:rhamnosyl/mannosyltransferase